MKNIKIDWSMFATVGTAVLLAMIAYNVVDNMLIKKYLPASFQASAILPEAPMEQPTE
jgi:hypothetical protein